MTAKNEVKMDSLPDLDELLQCPVCYEIPKAQIFQCNEGHHVCGRCKARIDVCPVCRSYFFGTRNYAMEELIASVKKLKAFRLVGKVTTDPDPMDPNFQDESSATENDEIADSEDNATTSSSARSTIRAPAACKGLFRCLCCKGGQTERLPAARMLNHLRFFHSSDLIEGKSEDGQYNQTWHFTTGGTDRIVTAIRVSDMGIFFFVIELSIGALYAWISMAAAPWVAHEFTYTISILGNDREAIFTDSVWSVRSCEGALKKRGHCLSVSGTDGQAFTDAATVRAKVCLRRTPPDLVNQRTPRVIVRVASRVLESPNAWIGDSPPEYEPSPPDHEPTGHDLEPYLQELHNDVERLSRAFAYLGEEAEVIRRMTTEVEPPAPIAVEPQPNPPAAPELPVAPAANMSRNARRRMRARLRQALNATEAPSAAVEAAPEVAYVDYLPVITPEPASGSSNNLPHQQNGQVRANKKKRRRHR